MGQGRTCCPPSLPSLCSWQETSGGIQITGKATPVLRASTLFLKQTWFGKRQPQTLPWSVCMASWKQPVVMTQVAGQGRGPCSCLCDLSQLYKPGCNSLQKHQGTRGALSVGLILSFPCLLGGKTLGVKMPSLGWTNTHLGGGSCGVWVLPKSQVFRGTGKWGTLCKGWPYQSWQGKQAESGFPGQGLI